MIKGEQPVAIRELTVNETAKSLRELCGRVLSFSVPYDDVAEQIEDLAYIEYGQGGLEDAVSQLQNLAHFFEGLRNKNEEVSRDLAQVYLLIGQIYQYAEQFETSIEWINKSIVVDDMYPVAYHCLAHSFGSIGDESLAVKSLEQEIMVAPGNYYTYLLLADKHEKSGSEEMFEAVLLRLLERDPDNIQALHRLIRRCERDPARTDVELLRRRLLNRTEGLSRIEAVIRAYHTLQMGRAEEAIDFLAGWSHRSPDVSIIHLANAHIYGQTHQYNKKRNELAQFKRKNHGREDVMEMKIAEFATVFGNEAADRLRLRLRVIYPAYV
jgi:tetratricopeptide (TPR) repeat protein